MRKKMATLTLIPSLLQLRVLCVLSQSLLQCRSTLLQTNVNYTPPSARSAGPLALSRGPQFETFAIVEEHMEFAGTEVFEQVRRE